MLRWCSYCQEFLGEGPPYDDLRITHGVCARCAALAVKAEHDDLAHGRALRHIHHQLVEAGAHADPSAAARVIEEARRANVRPVDALMGLVAPMLYEVGVQWEQALISVEEEHRFTAFCEELFELVSQRLGPPPATGAAAEQVVLMNAPGNRHRLALRLLTLWLASRHVRAWVVDEAEGLDGLRALIVRVRPRLLLISMALPEQRPFVVSVVDGLADVRDIVPTKVIVGGYAVKKGLVAPIPGAELLADISQLPS